MKESETEMKGMMKLATASLIGMSALPPQLQA